MKKENSHYYPISLDLKGKKCLVVGGGQVALRKVRTLLEYGARVEVISPDLCQELRRLGGKGTVGVRPREYTQGDLEGALIVMAATDQREINTKVGFRADYSFNDIENKDKMINNSLFYSQHRRASHNVTFAFILSLTI